MYVYRGVLANPKSVYSTAMQYRHQSLRYFRPAGCYPIEKKSAHSFSSYNNSLRSIWAPCGSDDRSRRDVKLGTLTDRLVIKEDWNMKIRKTSLLFRLIIATDGRYLG